MSSPDFGVARVERWSRCRTLPAVMLACSIANAAVSASPSADGGTTFDPGMLKGQGISPDVAGYFKLAPRFAPGYARVALTVNGNRKGLVDARFGIDGSLCATAEFLRKAGLEIPDDVLKSEDKALGTATPVREAALDAPCHDYRDTYPRTLIVLRPADAAVDIVAPADAVRLSAIRDKGSTSGGQAALLNYDLWTSSSRVGGMSSNYRSADLELGWNAGDWLVRSRQYYTATSGRSQWNDLYTYAQHTFVDQRSVFQAGHINPQSPLFATGSLYGAQWFPERALMQGAGSGATVEGIAQTQARVEVRQLGSLVYTTSVPAGPFVLTDLPLSSSNADLEVTVVEASGARRQFVVPAASFNRGRLGAAEGLSVAVGKLQGFDHVEAPWMATASNGWKLSPRLNAAAGVLLASAYRQQGVGLDIAHTSRLSSSWRVLASQAAGLGRGAQAAATVGFSGAAFGASVSATHRTAGYRDLSDTLVRRDRINDEGAAGREPASWRDYRVRDQYSASLSWSTRKAGGYTLTYLQSSSFNLPSNRQYAATWSYPVGRASLAVRLEHASGVGHARSGNTLYASINIPLGPRRGISAYVSRASDIRRQGVRYVENVNPQLNYSVSADVDGVGNDRAAGIAVNMLPRYAQVELSADRYGKGYTSTTAALRGAAVLHSGGVTLSPYRVRDTFGIVSVGDISNVEIQTPAGPVWSDPWGQAVIADMPEYRVGRVEVSTKSLPRNVDLNNSLAELEAGRGSVNHVNFEVVQVRRVLLSASMPDGAPAPVAATVIDRDGRFVTLVGSEGQIFWPHEEQRLPLRIVLPDERICQLQYSLPDKQDRTRYYEAAEASCGFPGP